MEGTSHRALSYLDHTDHVTHLGHPIRLCNQDQVYQKVYDTAIADLELMHQKPMPTPLRVKYANITFVVEKPFCLLDDDLRFGDVKKLVNIASTTPCPSLLLMMKNSHFTLIVRQNVFGPRQNVLEPRQNVLKPRQNVLEPRQNVLK